MKIKSPLHAIYYLRGIKVGSPERARWAHLAHSGSQLEHRIRFILPAGTTSCMIIEDITWPRVGTNFIFERWLVPSQFTANQWKILSPRKDKFVFTCRHVMCCWSKSTKISKSTGSCRDQVSGTRRARNPDKQGRIIRSYSPALHRNITSPFSENLSNLLEKVPFTIKWALL